MMFDIPLEYNSLSDKVQLGKYELAQYYDHFVRPETYLGTHYLSKFDDRLKMFLIYPRNICMITVNTGQKVMRLVMN